MSASGEAEDALIVQLLSPETTTGVQLLSPDAKGAAFSGDVRGFNR